MRDGSRALRQEDAGDERARPRPLQQKMSQRGGGGGATASPPPPVSLMLIIPLVRRACGRSA